MNEEKMCSHCQQPFQLFPEDLAFYEKLQVPPSDLCFHCRQQSLLVHTNQINLYQRKCDLTGEMIISNYSPEKPYKVYKQEVWWSDQWDAGEFAQDYDFNRSFFEQWQELSLKVPRPSLFTVFQYNENSNYVNHAGKVQNCYLIFDSDEDRDCYYSYSLNKCNDSSDLYRCRRSDLCYECIDCLSCYNCLFLQDSMECRDSAFLKNCIGCRNCFMSVNLRHKEYYFMNKEVSKEEYEKLMDGLKSRKKLDEYIAQFAEFQKQFPQRCVHGFKNENSYGDYLINTKNAYYCFDSSELWDCRYIVQAFMPMKDSMDCFEVGEGELFYMCNVAGYNGTRNKFCLFTFDQSHECEYSSNCNFSKNLFGCIGMRRKEYCILNKQYSKEEYEEMIPRIKKHMESTGEYGRFFPKELSSFAYNESTAQMFYPLTKERALAQGYTWRDEEIVDPQLTQLQKIVPPDRLENAPDNILQQTIACTVCSKPFRLVKQELTFYKRMGVALPLKCFRCRHFVRAAKRTPRHLFDRKCDHCKVSIRSSYSLDRPEPVYCEECYVQYALD